MADTLPVWTIRPNWRGGITERLEWKTDVMQSDTGVEQRRSVRVSPRRSLEFTVNPTRGQRTYLDLALHRLGAVEWLLPLWHDQGTLTVAALAGQKTVAFDNRWREHITGGKALLYVSRQQWAVIDINAQDDAGLYAVANLAAAWPKGTKVYPLRRALLDERTSISNLTSRVGQSQVLFTINEANDFPEVMPDDAVFGGMPVMTIEPNRTAEIKLDHLRQTDEQDGEIGLRYRTDDAGRAFGVQSYNWQVRGRQAQARFRSLLYWLRGRQRSIYLPSFNDDLLLTKPAAAGARSVTIEQAGIGYVGQGSPIPGRARFWTGTEMVLHSAMGVAGSAAEEVLTIGTPLVGSYAPGASWSFMEAARLASDTLEIMHHADSDGMLECSAGFQTFANNRLAPTPIYLPIVPGVENNNACGSPDADDPCAFPADDTVIFTMFYTMTAEPQTEYLSMSFPEAQPNGAGGKAISRIEPIVGSVEPFIIPENNVPGSDVLQGQPLITTVNYREGLSRKIAIVWKYPLPFGRFRFYGQVPFGRTMRFLGTMKRGNGPETTVIDFTDVYQAGGFVDRSFDF